MGWGGVGWAGLGWAGLGWAGLGWAGLGWAGLGWAGLGWAGLGWAGELAGLIELRWAWLISRLGWSELSHAAAGAVPCWTKLGCVGLVWVGPRIWWW